MLRSEIYKLVREFLTIRMLAAFFFTAGFLFSFFQIQGILFQDASWSGHFNPYTSFAIYAADLMFALSLLFYGFYVLKNSKRVYVSLGNESVKIAVFAFLLLAGISYFFSINSTVSFFAIMTLAKIFLVYFMVVNRFIKEETIINVFIGAAVLQATIAVLQFSFQSSIGLHFLGESLISPDSLNVAKVNIGSGTVLRAYGTMTHSNILGGILSFGFLLSLYMHVSKRIDKEMFVSISIVLLSGLLTSFSRSAWLATIISIGMFLAFRKYKIKYELMKKGLLGFGAATIVLYVLGILQIVLVRLNILADSSLVERLNQASISFNMLVDKPLGVGIGNYTNAAAKYSDIKLMPWEFQPVHNTFLLVGNELGIVALIGFITTMYILIRTLFKMLKKVKGKYKCYPLYFSIIFVVHSFILMSLDHYFYTNYTASIILITTLGLFTNLIINLEESGVVIQD